MHKKKGKSQSSQEHARGGRGAQEQKGSMGEEIRTSSVTGGTNGGTSNRSGYRPAARAIGQDEAGGTQGRGHRGH